LRARPLTLAVVGADGVMAILYVATLLSR
jgi:hypothetical protein